jgi:L-ascorbate oxidase
MSPFSDGTPMASQWPIPPLHYFDYEFQLEIGDAGTYFYHSHVGFSAITAAGVLIVEEKKGQSPPFHYDEERTIMFSDIYHDNDSYIVESLMKVPFRWIGLPDDIGINGHFRAVNTMQSQAGSSCSWAVITLKPDRTYRFRIIGATTLSWVYTVYISIGFNCPIFYFAGICCI